MKRLIARQPLRYGGRRLRKGDEFAAARGDARLLIAIGKAEMAPIAPPPAPVDRVRVLAPDNLPLGVSEAEVTPGQSIDWMAEAPGVPKRRRYYRRRDLAAEE